MEIIVVDLPPPEAARVMTPPNVRVTHLSRPAAETLPEARRVVYFLQY
jgi:hypothetical protein